MSNEDNYDISQISVPDSLIQEILEHTSPFEEETETVHTPQAEAPIEENGRVVELLSLLFEEFDKLNARFDSLQESINEMTTVGALGAPAAGLPFKEKKKKKKKPQREATDALAELLSRRIGR